MCYVWYQAVQQDFWVNYTLADSQLESSKVMMQVILSLLGMIPGGVLMHDVVCLCQVWVLFIG